MSQRKWISLSGVSILVLCSLPLVSGKLIAHLEQDYVLKPTATANTADAIVVLSGMVRTIEGEDGLAYEWGEASDRIFAGIDLINKQKAPLLIVTGGKLLGQSGDQRASISKKLL